MRNGIAAIVPIFLAITLFFFVIMFMGGTNDTLGTVSKVKHLQHIEAKLAVPALKLYDELDRGERNIVNADGNVTKDVEDYVKTIMAKNGVGTSPDYVKAPLNK